MRVFIGGPTNSARDIDTYNVPQKSPLHDSKSVHIRSFPAPVPIITKPKGKPIFDSDSEKVSKK